MNDLDVFEDLRQRVGCEYISSLKSPLYIAKVRKVLRKLSLDNYSLFQLNDLANYIYGYSFFVDKEEALKFFAKRKF